MFFFRLSAFVIRKRATPYLNITGCACMWHFALFRWIRGLLPAFVIILLILISTALIIVTTAGIPAPLIERIERELARREINVKIDKIRIEFLDGFGLVARHIEFFDKVPTPGEEPLVLISRIKLDLSMDSLMKGDFGVKDIKGIEVKGIFVSLPLNEKGKETKVRLELKDLNGDVVFPMPGLADFSQFSWELEGIKFDVQGVLRFQTFEERKSQAQSQAEATPAPRSQEEELASKKNKEERVREIVRVLKYIESVKLSQEEKPSISVKFDVNAQDIPASRVFLTAKAPFVETHGYRFNKVNLEASYQSGTISVENFSFKDRNGELNWEGSYKIQNRYLIGHLNSSLRWNPVLKSFLKDTSLPLGLKLTQGIGISADMRMTLDENTYRPVEWKAFGEMSSRNFQLSGINIQKLSADFSLEKDKYYLDNVRVVLPDSELFGRFLYEEDLVRVHFESNIPLEVYLKLARESGAEINIPADVAISGIPDIKAEARIKLSPDKSLRPAVDVSASVRCRDIAYKNVKFSEITLDAVYRNGEGSIPQLIAKTPDNREFSLSGEYYNDELKFKVSSDLPLNDWYQLISDWKKDIKLPEELVISGIPVIRVEGQVNGLMKKGTPPDIRKIQLSLNCPGIAYRDVDFNSMNMEASYEGGNLNVPELSLTRPNGREVRISGSILNDDLSVNIHSNLLIDEIYKMARDPMVQMHRDYMVYGKAGKLDCTANFKTNIKDFWNFKVTGNASTSDLKYNGVPVESGSTSFEYIPGILTLNDSKIVYIYDNYDMAGKDRTSPAANRGTVLLKKLVNYEKNSTIELVGLDAHAYPEPVLQMFAPHLVPVLKQFRFHEVPYIKGGGMIDIVDPNLSNTDLKITFSTKGKVDYDFLKKPLKMQGASGRLTIRREKLYLDDFAAKLWGGQARGRMGMFVVGKEGYDGSFKFVNCNLKNVGETYGTQFDNAYVNANIDFSMMGGQTKDLKAGGKIELTEGNLLSIPFFGPLSGLFDSVFGFVPGVGDLVGSKISQASCDYYIGNGDFVTKDFVATGSNMKISGIASVNLDKVTLDMSIRVDFKSLIGLILKPISIPFGGLFEFHGVGPLEKPTWSVTPFSGAYSEGQKK